MKTTLSAFCIFLCALSVSCERTTDGFKPETIISRERAALDRWFNGDPQGYLETYAPEVTYFDPLQDKRVDGAEAMRKYLTPVTGKIKGRYDMIDPKVQHHGDVAVLSYNLLSYGKTPEGVEKLMARWNSTKVYGRLGGEWKLIHDHWSFIKPELKRD